ncbi:MAG TPA: MarR family transcriptional regulator [Agromyces sp.]
MARDEVSLRAAVDQSTAVLAGAGFPRMPARVLMALLVSDRGLTASELGGGIGASAAAISGAVRYLEQLGVVHRVRERGSRRDRFEFSDDAWYRAIVQKSSIYSVIAELSERAADAIDDESHAGVRRLRDTAGFYRFLDGKMPELLAEWDAQRDATVAPSAG